MNQTCLANYIQSIFRLEKITATKTITIIHKFKRNTVGERNTSIVWEKERRTVWLCRIFLNMSYKDVGRGTHYKAFDQD